MRMCVLTKCMHVHTMCAWCLRVPEMTSEPLELELWTAVSGSPVGAGNGTSCTQAEEDNSWE